jgi:hypothetical protein
MVVVEVLPRMEKGLSELFWTRVNIVTRVRRVFEHFQDGYEQSMLCQ